MQKILKYGLIIFLVASLILVRFFAPKIFYDPFLHYFKNDYLHTGIPIIEKSVFFRDLFFRYVLNSILSIAILYLLFKEKYLKFTLWFYVIAFVVLSSVLFLILKIGTADYKLLFYIRRFLIHPVFLLLLLPAFYGKDKMDLSL